MLELRALENTKKQTIKLYEEAESEEIREHYWEKLVLIERKIMKLQKEGKENKER